MRLWKYTTSPPANGLTARFLASEVNSGGSKIEPTQARHEYYHDNPDRILVQARRISDVLEGQRFDHVVLDVEGQELAALIGMGELLCVRAPINR